VTASLISLEGALGLSVLRPSVEFARERNNVNHLGSDPMDGRCALEERLEARLEELSARYRAIHTADVGERDHGRG
jgi:hypothetical protein